MAIFKKKSGESNQKSAKNMPTEFVEVVGYDLEANEIIAKRIEKEGEEVRIGFLPVQNPGKYARPEVEHFIGKKKKPRDMTTQPGGIMKLNRMGVSEDLTNGKLMVSWVDAWVRNPDEEFVLKGTASITYLAEKEALREDGTRGHKGLMTVLCDDRYSSVSRGDALSKRIWKGESPAMAESAADLTTKLANLIDKGLSAGVRFVDETAENGSRLAAAVVYPKYGVSPSDVVSSFISNLDEEALGKIGDSIKCEVIPAVSLQIGNDTAGELFTGKKADDKPSHMGKVRELFSSVIEQGSRTIQIPKFMDAGILVRLRTPKEGDPYLSVENINPHFGVQSVGIADAVISASTKNSTLFALKDVAGKEKQAKKQDAPKQGVPAQEPETSPEADVLDAEGPGGVDEFFGEAAQEDDLSSIFGDDDDLFGESEPVQQKQTQANRMR